MKKGRIEKKVIPDVFTIVMVTALVLFGLVALLNVLSDPFDGSETTFEAFMEKLNFEYFNRQLANIAISLLVAVPMAILDYHKYKPFVKVVYVINVVLLLLLIIAGESSRGMLGWYKIGTTRAFQPSEICKVTLIVALSKFCSEVVEKRGSFKRFVDVALAFLIFAVPCALVIKQPDIGTAMVMLCIFIGIVFAAKVAWTYIIAAAVVSGISLPLIYRFALPSEAKTRIQVFLNPTLDPEGSGMNALRSKEIIGSGGLFGKGMFTSGTLSQTGYVPERHTDFIFSSIGECLGFIGGILLILAFFALLVRWMLIAINAQDCFGRCLVTGCVCMIGVHVFENIGMNVGVMPITGIPLPFISYGGSNMLASLVAVGIVLSVHYRSKLGTRL
ncbi:MAG TPA: FtsW/RodA/SpoVE family cell cycle protein [Eubacteriales bacterium]|nr:FtsW/RodA/SpoVE family cell cycle protein [Clostridia bacterium]HRV72959.1 FtsW/RodA/SpoVE family cell cycle protein [Eubacteriales bacterium]